MSGSKDNPKEEAEKAADKNKKESEESKKKKKRKESKSRSTVGQTLKFGALFISATAKCVRRRRPFSLERTLCPLCIDAQNRFFFVHFSAG